MQALVIEDTDEETLHQFIEERAKKGTTVYTDGAHAYNNLDEYEHDTVIHSRGEYARGDVTTNGIESFGR